jgi:DNA-binding MarR family transcriptional regulator
MGTHAQIKPGHAQEKRRGEVTSIFIPKLRRDLSKPVTGQEWRKELLISWLFQTCIRLQTSLDRCFLTFGMSGQEARVLIRCVESRRISPGKLAVALGRDKGKMTRYIDRLESRHLLIREIDQRDRRFSILKPTAKGKQVARDLASIFDNIRKELFTGILESDVRRLSQTLARLHKNAIRIGARRRKSHLRVRRRIGSHRVKSQGKEISQPQAAADALTHSPNGHAANTVAVEFV